MHYFVKNYSIMIAKRQFCFTSLLLLLSLLILLPQCSTKHRQVKSVSKPVQHKLWDSLLKTHVNDNGGVNYQGFISDSLTLNKYLDLLKQNHPNEANWSREEQLVYWINAYNAFTVKLIVDNFPVKSIKDIGGAIPFVNSSWDVKFIEIEGQTYDLNNLEHSILRKDFEEPRIHFAVNCASVSCPALRNEAFVANRVEEQLADAASQFINDSSKNKIAAEEIKISKIFSWFSGDFTSANPKGIKSFLNKYSKVKINDEASVDYLDYNWGLNDEKAL